MKKSFRVIGLTMVLLLSACNLGAQQETPVTQVAEDVATATPEDEQVPEPVATEVQHEMIPGELPEERDGLAGDQDSSITAQENRAPGGDRFTFGRFERPFNTNPMDVYYPEIDILVSEVYTDADWVYGTLTMKDNGSGCSLSGNYGYELDANVDGGGDVLVMASNPSSSEWTTAGVQVWFDENDDVGGKIKMSTDEIPAVFNGYETQLFGEGSGDDPDLAWVRLAPGDPCTVQLAVKNSVVDGSKIFMIGMWAGNDLFDPALFDHNDAYSHDQAGSSLKEFEYFYPLNEVFALDNVCRMTVGFQSTGNEPGACPSPAIEQEELPPPPGNACPPPSILFCSRNGCYCLYPQG